MIKLSKVELVKMDKMFIDVLATSDGKKAFEHLSGNAHQYKYLSVFETEDEYSLYGYDTLEELKQRLESSIQEGEDSGWLLTGVWNLETKKEVEVVTEVSVTIKE